MRGVLDEEVTEDIFNTLYGCSGEALKGKTFGHRVSLEVGFFEEGSEEGLFFLSLNLPFAPTVCKREDWEALQWRMATRLGASEGKKFQPASWDQICDFMEQERNVAMAEEFAQMGVMGEA